MYKENEIKDLKAELDSHFLERDGHFDVLTNYYEQHIEIPNMPEDVTLYQSPAARKQVDAAVAHVLALDEKVEMPVSETKDSKERVSAFVQFGTSYINRINQMCNMRRICTKHGFLYGMHVRKGPIYVPRLAPDKKKDEFELDYKDRIKEFEKSLEYSFPFYHRAVHPKNILYDNIDNPTIVFERFARKALSIRKEFPKWKSSAKDYEDVDWWECWTATQRFYFMGTKAKGNVQSIEETSNVYGFIPYFIGDSGFGLDTGDDKPGSRVAGLISPALSSYKMEMRLKTAVAYGFEFGVYGQRSINKAPTSDLKISNMPGEVSEIPDHYKYKVEDSPKVMADAYNFLSLIREEQEMITTRAAMGATKNPYQAASALNINVSEAKLQFGGMAEAWEKNMSAMLNNSFWLIKNVIKEPVGIQGNFGTKSAVTVKPAQIDTNEHRFYVELDAMVPEQRDRRIMLGLRMFMSNALSWETCCKQYWDIDSEKEEQRMLIQGAMQSAMVKEAIAFESLKDAGMTDVVELIMKGQMPSQQKTENFRDSDYMRRETPASPQLQEMPEEMPIE